MKDPAVASIGSAIGAGGGNTTVNNGRIYIALKPYKQRNSMETILARLRTNLAKIQGITLYMQAAQDITIGGRVSKTQYQYTLGTPIPAESPGRPCSTRPDQEGPRHHRRRNRPAEFRSPARHHHQARGGLELRHLPFSHRQHAR